MAFQDKVPLSIVNLNADCLFQLFSHLKLSDVVNFRSQCSFLNDVVLKYLLSIPTLSIVYTEHEDLKEITCFVDQVLENCSQTHFRRKDFIVISGRQKYAKFLRFIGKCSPNIKKLALIIDPDPVEFPKVSVASELLNICPKVETLFLDRTNRYAYGFLANGIFTVDDIGRLFISIAKLASLSELHFFGRRDSRISFAVFYAQTSYSRNLFLSMIGHFLSTMLRKLRIFRINHSSYTQIRPPLVTPKHLLPASGRTFEDVLKLSFDAQDFVWLSDTRTKFQNLHTLRLFGLNAGLRFGESIVLDSFEKVRVLHFDCVLSLSEAVMFNLNSLPNIEKVSAERIYVSRDFQLGRRIADQYINRTIKHIQVTDRRRCSNTEPQSLPFAYIDVFTSLQTVTVLKPKVVTHQRNSFAKFRLPRLNID